MAAAGGGVPFCVRVFETAVLVGFAAAAAAYGAIWGAGLYMKTSGSATGGVVHTLALVSSDAYPHRTARATLPQPSCSRTTSREEFLGARRSRNSQKLVLVLVFLGCVKTAVQ